MQASADCDYNFAERDVGSTGSSFFEIWEAAVRGVPKLGPNVVVAPSPLTSFRAESLRSADQIAVLQSCGSLRGKPYLAVQLAPVQLLQLAWYLSEQSAKNPPFSAWINAKRQEAIIALWQERVLGLNGEERVAARLPFVRSLAEHHRFLGWIISERPAAAGFLSADAVIDRRVRMCLEQSFPLLKSILTKAAQVAPRELTLADVLNDFQPELISKIPNFMRIS